MSTNEHFEKLMYTQASPHTPALYLSLSPLCPPCACACIYYSTYSLLYPAKKKQYDPRDRYSRDFFGSTHGV